MAKDPAMSGPVSDIEGGTYPSSEEVRDEGLTRSEIINAFGEDLGRKLLDGGYASFGALDSATDDDLLAIAGIGPASVTKIREVITSGLEAVATAEMDVTVEEADVLEVETPDEKDDAQAVEADAPEDAVTEGLVEEVPDEAPGEEVLPEQPPEGLEEDPGPSPDDHDLPPGIEIADPPPFPEPEEPEPDLSQMSVRVQRAYLSRIEREKAEQAESERIEAARIAGIGVGADVGSALGHVGVDFVPEPDPEPLPDIVTPPAVEGEGGTEPADPKAEALGNVEAEVPEESE